MYSQNNIYNTLTLEGTKEVHNIKNNNNNYITSTLTCLGGGSFHKGLSIGMQDNMVNGLLIYDDDNFFGYSEKNGLILLSINNDFKELELPLFDEKLEKTEKTLNIDLSFRDTINYYLNIPNSILKYDINLIFNIKFIYDDESLINQINLYIINDLQKNIEINIKNNIYFNNKELITNNQEGILKFNINYINQEYMTCKVEKFIK